METEGDYFNPRASGNIKDMINSDLKSIFEFLAQSEPDTGIPRCDAIFVFGTTTGQVAGQAAHLYQIGKADHLIISGKHRHDKTEGPFGFASEAEYLASIATNAGVPKDTIILEREAINTYENTIFGMKAARDAGIDPKNLIIVSIPYLLRRAQACFAKNFPEIKTYGSAMSVNEDFFTPYRIERIKGEFPRFKKYAEAGTIAPVEVPQEIQRKVALIQ